MIEVIKELGPWVLSGIAILQVWIIAIWKKFAAKGTVEIHESGNIEIGYAELGPTVGLTGTLEGVRGSVFIRRMGLCVTRMSDQSKHNFFWRAFRPNTVLLGKVETNELELAGSFLLSPENPSKFNIFFVDENFVDANRPKLAPFKNEWFEYRRRKFQELQEAESDLVLTDLLKDESLTEYLYDSFSKTPAHTSEFTLLDRNFYWEAGNYELQLTVEASRPKRVIEKNFRFKISEEQAKTLRLNSINTLKAVCGIEQLYHFIYPKYEGDD